VHIYHVGAIGACVFSGAADAVGSGGLVAWLEPWFLRNAVRGMLRPRERRLSLPEVHGHYLAWAHDALRGASLLQDIGQLVKPFMSGIDKKSELGIALRNADVRHMLVSCWGGGCLLLWAWPGARAACMLSARVLRLARGPCGTCAVVPAGR
jgi:hypothetical protein